MTLFEETNDNGEIKIKTTFTHKFFTIGGFVISLIGVLFIVIGFFTKGAVFMSENTRKHEQYDEFIDNQRKLNGHAIKIFLKQGVPASEFYSSEYNALNWSASNPNKQQFNCK